MDTKRKILFSVLFIVVLGTLIYLYHHEDVSLVGESAPDFSLQNALGNESQLIDFKGKWILLNFWATWCPPCLEEMPSMEAMYQKYREQGLEVVAISVDEGGWASVRSFLKKVRVTFPILLDKTSEVAYSYGTFQLPESYLVDPQQKIVKKFIGPQDWMSSGMRGYFEEVLNEDKK